MRLSLLPRAVGALVVVALGVYYIGFDILGWRIGNHTYSVSVDLPSASGVYASGAVTYRGVQVGKISSLDLSPTGVRVVLQINRAYKIPEDSSANVRELSALGEQYVDLVPAGPQGPYLHNGSVIPEDDTTVPVLIGTALDNADNLLDHLDPDDIHILEKFLTTGVTGTGPALGNLVTVGKDLTQAFIAAAPATASTITDGQIVLQAADDTTGQLTSFIRSLDQVATQLQSSDGDIRSLLGNGSSAEAALNQLATAESGPFEDLLDGTAAVGQQIAANTPSVNLLFAELPAVATKLASTADGDAIRGALSINGGQPICTYTAAPLALPSSSPGAPSLTNTCGTTGP
jgi:phospholipid/cholesterol/gamma-HCH transport system substrate-binding protein